MTAENVSRAIGSLSPEALERLIYVVGSARGGTSITKDVIGAHDNVISFLGPTHFLNHPWKHRKRLEPRLWNVVYWLPANVRRADVRDSLDPPAREAFIRHVNRALVRRDFRELYQLYPLTRALDPEEPRAPQDIVAWLDKGNDFWGVDLIARHFPQARFVFVVRDPRGSVASLAKRMADDRPDTEFKVAPRDVIASTIYWRNLAQQELRFARNYPERTIFFRFEDLVIRPFEIVPLLYDFLGLPAVAEHVLRSKLDSLVYSASLDAEKCSGLSTKPVERWRSKLSEEVVDCVAELCAPTARRFGYELKDPARRRGLMGLARQAGGARAQVTVAAKLAYLTLCEAQLGAAPSVSFPPMRLVAAA
jgi:Sulfotransferase family